MLVKRKFEAALGLFLIILALAMIIFVCVTIVEKNGNDEYKQGQIDALTGHIKFELVTCPDSTKVWKEIKNSK